MQDRSRRLDEPVDDEFVDDFGELLFACNKSCESIQYVDPRVLLWESRLTDFPLRGAIYRFEVHVLQDVRQSEFSPLKDNLNDFTSLRSQRRRTGH